MNKEELFDRFIQAINTNDFKVVKQCVEKGVDVNRCYDVSGDTPLFLCMRKSKDSRIFDYLVDHGADVTKKIGHSKMKDNEKVSLLNCFFHYSNAPVKILYTILENGGDIHIGYAPKGMKSPLEIAIAARNRKLVSLFNQYLTIKIDLDDLDRKSNNKTIKNKR